MNNVWQYKFESALIEKAVPRIKLLSKLNTVNQATVNLIEAPAGYGKTYFAYQIAQKHDTPVFWYRADENDNDSRVLIQGIIAGLKYLTGESEILIKTPENRLYLTAEIIMRHISKQFKNGLTIIFDDVHFISNTESLQLLTDMLCAVSANKINFILTAREKIDLSDQKLLSSGRLLRFSGDELRFTREELNMYLQLRNIGYSEDTLDELYENTNGWIASVNLLLLSGQIITANKISDISSIINYINSEIMEALSPETKSFLINTSIFDMLEPDICDNYLNIVNSAELLEKLEKQHFLLYKTDVGAYKIHDLIAQTLKQQMDDPLKQNNKAAQTYINMKRPVTGINYLLAANLLDQASEMMEKHVPSLIRQGNWEIIKNWMFFFDDEYIVSKGFLCILAAELNVYDSSVYMAEKYLYTAKKLYTAQKDQVGYARCLNVEARILRSQGQYQESIAKLEDVMEILAGERFDIPMETALSYLFIGDFANVEKTLQTAYKKALNTMDNNMIAHIVVCMAHFNYLKGDYSNSVALYNKAASLSDNDIYFSHFQRSCLATIYQDWGMLDKALEVATDSIAIKERYNLLDTLPYAYYQLAHIYVDLGRFDKAEIYYNKSIATADEIGGETFFKILSKMLLSRCYIKRGNIIKAKATAREAVKEAIEEGGYIEAICCMLMGIIFLQMNRFEDGEKFIDRGRELIETAKPKYFLTMLYGSLAYIALKKNDNDNSTKYGMLYIELSAANNFIQMSISLYKMFRPVIEVLPEDKLTFTQKSFIMELDDRCKKDNIITKIFNTEKHTLETNYKILQALHENSLKVPFLANMFGSFEIYYHNNKITLKGLFSQKAKELLIYLLHKGQKVAKDEIIEALWPDSQSKNIDNVFHATLYNLRKGLQKIEPGYEYITYEIGMYTVEKDVFFAIQSYYCSALMMLSNANKLGEKEIALMEDILSCYNKEYLYNLDREWLEKSRSFYETLFEKATLRVSKYYLETSKNIQAIQLLYKLIELNPYMDEAYYLLIKAQLAENQRQAAKRIYENYVAILKNEVHAEPSEKIMKLF